MRTLKASIAIAATILVCALIASGCSNGPLESNSGELNSGGNNLTNEIRKGESSMKVQFILEPGEKKVISVADFDQVGLLAFTSVQIEATDPRLPIYQIDHCGNVDIYVDHKGDYKSGPCTAAGFSSTEIVFLSKADLTLNVEAEVGTIKDF